MPSSGGEWEIVSLGPAHQRESFTSGVASLDEWIRKYARQNEELGLTHTYVAVPRGELDVVGYFSIRTSEVLYASLPPEEVRRFPKYPVPSILLARLAVDRSVQGKGLGADLLMAALTKALRVSEIAGAFVVDVVAINEAARKFYLKFEFREILDDPTHLYLRMSKIRTLLG